MPGQVDQPDDSRRFKPDMPSIPGVNVAPARRSAFSSLSAPLQAILLISPLFILAAVVSWAVLRTSRASSRVTRPAPLELELPAPPTPAVTRSPGAIATVRDLSAPWSSKTFDFRKSSGEIIPSIVVRLPGPPAARRSYWAFALQERFVGRCQLEYITVLEKLASDYSFRATHPMVADPCTRTVFDPLQMASLASGAWARGAVVQGTAFRPPLGIDVRIEGDELIATQIE